MRRRKQSRTFHDTGKYDSISKGRIALSESSLLGHHSPGGMGTSINGTPRLEGDCQVKWDIVFASGQEPCWLRNLAISGRNRQFLSEKEVADLCGRVCELKAWQISRRDAFNGNETFKLDCSNTAWTKVQRARRAAGEAKSTSSSPDFASGVVKFSLLRPETRPETLPSGCTTVPWQYLHPGATSQVCLDDLTLANIAATSAQGEDGKERTTLVATFRADLRRNGDAWIGGSDDDNITPFFDPASSQAGRCSPLADPGTEVETFDCVLESELNSGSYDVGATKYTPFLNRGLLYDKLLTQDW